MCPRYWRLQPCTGHRDAGDRWRYRLQRPKPAHIGVGQSNHGSAFIRSGCHQTGQCQSRRHLVAGRCRRSGSKRESTTLAPAPSQPVLPPNSSPARDTVAAPPSSTSTPSTPPITFDANTVLPSKVPYASPAVRLLARHLGVDLSQIKGSEKHGRITREDVQKSVKTSLSTGIPESRTPPAPVTANGSLALLTWPNVDFSKFGEIETQSLSRIKKFPAPTLLAIGP